MVKSKLIKRELYIALHSQSSLFRIIKWIILILITYTIFLWKGWLAVGLFVIIGAVLGLSMHFFFRWKTHGWRRAWGKFKPIKTPFD